MLMQTDIIEMIEEDRAYQRVKELVDMVKPYDIDKIDPDIIDKINVVGCTSFKCKVIKADDKVYILPIGDKPIKMVVESDTEDKLHKDVEELYIRIDALSFCFG